MTRPCVEIEAIPAMGERLRLRELDEMSVTMRQGTVFDNLQKRKQEADKVARALAAPGSSVLKLSNAKRGNDSYPYPSEDIDKFVAATLEEEINRARDSIKRFAG